MGPYDAPPPKRGLPAYDYQEPPPARGWFCVGALTTLLLILVALLGVLAVEGDAVIDDLLDGADNLALTEAYFDDRATGIALGEIALAETVLSFESLTPDVTATPSLTGTPTPLPTETNTPTATLTTTPTPSDTPTPTETASATPSASPTETRTPTATITPTRTATYTATPPNIQRDDRLPPFLDASGVGCSEAQTVFTLTINPTSGYTTFGLDLFLSSDGGQFTALDADPGDTLDAPFGLVLVQLGENVTLSLAGQNPTLAAENITIQFAESGTAVQMISLEWFDFPQQPPLRLTLEATHPAGAGVLLNMRWQAADAEVIRSIRRLRVC